MKYGGCQILIPHIGNNTYFTVRLFNRWGKQGVEIYSPSCFFSVEIRPGTGKKQVTC